MVSPFLRSASLTFRGAFARTLFAAKNRRATVFPSLVKRDGLKPLSLLAIRPFHVCSSLWAKRRIVEIDEELLQMVDELGKKDDEQSKAHLSALLRTIAEAEKDGHPDDETVEEMEARLLQSWMGESSPGKRREAARSGKGEASREENSQNEREVEVEVTMAPAESGPDLSADRLKESIETEGSFDDDEWDEDVKVTGDFDELEQIMEVASGDFEPETTAPKDKKKREYSKLDRAEPSTELDVNAGEAVGAASSRSTVLESGPFPLPPPRPLEEEDVGRGDYMPSYFVPQRPSTSAVSNRRRERISATLRRGMEEFLRSSSAEHSGLYIDRIPEFMVTDVQMTRDLRKAYVYFSADPTVAPALSAVLDRLKGKARRYLSGGRLKSLKYSPEIEFRSDEAPVKEDRVDQLFEEIRRRREEYENQSS